MKFDKRKEVYWVIAIVLLALMVGFLLFGKKLWSGEPIDIQLHDTYFVFSPVHGLVAIFFLLIVVVNGFRAAFGSRIIFVRILAGIVAVALLGLPAVMMMWVYQAHTQLALARMEEPREGKFSLSKYPPSAYHVTYDTITVDSFRVVLIVAVESDTTITQTGEVWLQRLVGDSITQKSVGAIDSEVGVWVPDQQPIPGMFMTVEYSEYGGKINLIGERGGFIEIPGTRYVLDGKGRIYTAYLNDHDTLVHVYDLKNHYGTYLDNKQFLRNDLTFQQAGPGRWLYRQK